MEKKPAKRKVVETMLYPILTDSRFLSDLSGIWRFQLDNGHGFEEKWYERPMEDAMNMPVPSSYNDLRKRALISGNIMDGCFIREWWKFRHLRQDREWC